MSQRKKALRKIVVALWMGNASGREILSGVCRCARETKAWQITLLVLPNGFSTALVNQILAEGADGIITSDAGNETIRMLADALTVPLVIIGPPADLPRARGGTVSFVGRDDLGIGRLGARYLLSIGRFNSYGFVQEIDKGEQSTSDRELGFARTLAAAGHVCQSLSAFAAPPDTSDTDRLHLWLKTLPKPAAIMCFYDPPATQVLEACRELGFAVPTQVSVLGVDNDEPICETATPPLSSLQPDHENMGYLAARQLQAILLNRKRLGRKIVLTHRIVERDTTRQMAPSANLVRRAKAFIADNATNGIDVQDVATALGVSRRLADLRFREVENSSIHEAIERRRLDVATQRLRQTAWPISRIAQACGYASPQAFRTAFAKRFKRSPRAYRQQAS
ncbi:MAG: substrate-binding domain-containing protein [Kiritimatiellae bacterium]|nr:substrate-binding domain-containing protein [Kiritimatiellia bacterium]